MKVAFVSPLSISFYGGGGEKWICETAKLLRARGHDVKIHATPYVLRGRRFVTPHEVLGDVPYHES